MKKYILIILCASLFFSCHEKQSQTTSVQNSSVDCDFILPNCIAVAFNNNLYAIVLKGTNRILVFDGNCTGGGCGFLTADQIGEGYFSYTFRDSCSAKENYKEFLADEAANYNINVPQCVQDFYKSPK